jgi:uncharacterized RmlC-like cupin family protein
MAKASSGRQRSANTAAAAELARKKAKAASAAPVRAAAKKSAVKKAAAKQAGAKTSAAKKASAKKAAAKQPASAKAAAKVAAAPKRAAAKKPGSAKAPAKLAAAAKPTGKKSAPKHATPAKPAAARTVAVKSAVPRRPAVRVAAPVPAARRGRAAPAPRKARPVKVSTKAPQVFAVSHLQEADFKADGLRAYALYRDLGIAAASSGRCQAHVIRFVPPCTDEVRKRHVHEVELQLVYVLQGWIKNEFEGHGEQMMSAGSCWLQPAGIRHTVLDYSPDCEVLEIIVPADFKTEELV